MKLVGQGGVRYIDLGEESESMQSVSEESLPEWIVSGKDADVKDLLESADVVVSGLRNFSLFKRRTLHGLKTFYMTERWFKPPMGMFRLAHPRYFAYVWQLCWLMKQRDFICLPIGIHSARDIARLCGLMNGDLRCLFKTPELEFDKRPGGRIWLKNAPRNKQSAIRYCLGKMRMWGYFVQRSEHQVAGLERIRNSQKEVQSQTSEVLRLLWFGRMLGWKRADTVIRAVKRLVSHLALKSSNACSKVLLDIYGSGPEEDRLKKLSIGYEKSIHFYPPVPMADVRRIMRNHDVCILASNGYEGWGAVANEALEEGLKVIGTKEAGSSATILQERDLFSSGDVLALERLLIRCMEEKMAMKLGGGCICMWTARGAAEALIALMNDDPMPMNNQRV